MNSNSGDLQNLRWWAERSMRRSVGRRLGWSLYCSQSSDAQLPARPWSDACRQLLTWLRRHLLWLSVRWWDRSWRWSKMPKRKSMCAPFNQSISQKRTTYKSDQWCTTHLKTKIKTMDNVQK